MQGQEISLFIAFLFGMASVISPCVLPIIPGFLSFITGTTIKEIKESAATRNPFKQKSFYLAVMFVLGFSTVFVMLGVTASAVGQLLMRYMSYLTTIAAIFIFLFGLHMSGIFRITKLMGTKRVDMDRIKGGSFVGAYFLGVAFSIGWTPCVGPILAAILLMASNADTVAQGAMLLGAYSLGYGIPFLLITIFINSFQNQMIKFGKYLPVIEKVSGYLLMIVAILIYFGWMDKLAGLLY